MKIYDLVNSIPNKIEKASTLGNVILAINSIFTGEKKFSAREDQGIKDELEKLAKGLANFLVPAKRIKT